MIEVVNLAAKFALFHSHWDPKIVGELNGQHIKLARLLGEFVWHTHEREDEMFLVLSGTLEVRLRERTVMVGEGEFIIIPRGVEHCPCAAEEVQVLLFEPAGTLNTGDAESERSVQDPERI